MKPCVIEGCQKPARTRAADWCEKHYYRWRRHGDPLGKAHGTEADRFWAKVDLGRPLGCWWWTGAKSVDGYGHFKTGAGAVAIAHRWSYEHLIGPIPEGLHIDHLCRNRACVNPDHLEPVTCATNVRRGMVSESNRRRDYSSRRRRDDASREMGGGRKSLRAVEGGRG